MADAIVSFLAEKLTSLVVKEAQLLGGVENEVKSLSSDLRFMILFLNQSQGKRKELDLAEVVNQIRDIAHEAEDVIDTYIANMVNQRKKGTLGKVFDLGLDHARMLRNVAQNIRKIKTTVEGIFNNKEKFCTVQGGRRDTDEEAERIRRQRGEVEEDHVVGFESYSRVVIDKLMTRASPLNVVSIIGMGGLGKTTLARKIYNNDRVKDMFPCRAWGYVSNDYRAGEFFLSLLKCLLPDESIRGEGSNEEVMKMKVREYLKERKYLVVVDDVWRIQDWDQVKDAFPDNRNGSRILITTRLVKVASHAGPTPPYSLPFQNKPKSWELLSNKVFRGQNCPSDLVDIGKSIAENCHGLPLAIVVMAEILANKKSSFEWSKINDHVNWHLGRDNTLKEILKLSYDTLPARLKPCFLYLGMYPQHYRIPAKQLILLWISEGLLTQETNSPSTNTPEPEYIAERYLDELVDRSLVQVVHRTYDDAVKTCRIHHVIRHLCISESRDDKFFEVCAKIDSKTQTQTQTQTHITCPRRLSLYGELFDLSSTLSLSVSATRSLLCFGPEASEVNPENWKWLLESFKLARVLDLGRMNVNSLPIHFKKLIHLRYLRIINSQILETIPSSICRLWNLETLYLGGSPIKSLSAELWQLKQLRHLLMIGPVDLPSGSETMPNLQTLSSVALNPHTASLLDNGTFPRLTKLALHYEQSHQCDPREQLQSLHRLSHLRKLKVIGTTNIPDFNVFPSTVTKITLTKFDFFNSDVMHTLGKLQNLQVLKLLFQKDNTRFDLHCAAEGFPKLQVFVMNAIKLKSWRVEKGSMPCLRRVILRNCKFLNKLPRELWAMTSLGLVHVSWPSAQLVKTLQNLEMKDDCKLLVYPLHLMKN